MGTKLTMKRVLWLLGELITEPIGLLAFLGMTTYALLLSLGLLYVVCEQHYGGDPQVSCARRVYPEHIEKAIHKTTAGWTSAMYMAYLIPAAVAGFILGAWGDRVGRKSVILLALTGLFMAVGSLTLVASVPSIPLWFLPAFGVLVGITGFIGTLPVSCQAFIADRSAGDPSNLSIRMFGFKLAMGIGTMCGGSISAAVFSGLGLQYVGTVAMIFLSIGVFWTALRMPGRSPAEEKARSRRVAIQRCHELGESIPEYLIQDESDMSDAQGNKQSSAWAETLTTLEETFTACFKPRAGYQRALILTSGIINFIDVLTTSGMYSTFALYVTERPLSWSGSLLGYHLTFSSITGFGLSCLFIFCGKKLLKAPDLLLAAVACFTVALELLLKTFARTTWLIFASDVIGAAKHTLGPLLKAGVAALLPPDELGKVFAMFGLGLDFGNVFGALIFNGVFAATSEAFPGAPFLLAAALQFSCVIVLLFLWRLSKKDCCGFTCCEKTR